MNKNNPAVCPKCLSLADIQYDEDGGPRDVRLSWTLTTPHRMLVEFKCENCGTVFDEIYIFKEKEIISHGVVMQSEEDIE